LTQKSPLAHLAPAGFLKPGFLASIAGRNRPPTRSSRDDGDDDDGGCGLASLLKS
jgi:hypothetical protein